MTGYLIKTGTGDIKLRAPCRYCVHGSRWESKAPCTGCLDVKSYMYMDDRQFRNFKAKSLLSKAILQRKIRKGKEKYGKMPRMWGGD